MDLPKNVTQIGEADEVCKIYVEDYVVSYLKQLNPLARDKTMAAALYGKRKTEENVTFLFVYGAGKLDFIQKETSRLSQAQRQEIERIKKQYFDDYEFLGYRILDGGMVDGFHVCEQDSCRYVEGYAQFYEKNEAMLSYMLESRQAEAVPENIDSGKYDAARSRQEKRREKYSRGSERAEGEGEVNAAQKNGLRVAAAFVLLLLCAFGVAVNSPALTEKGFSWEKLKADLRERKLAEEETGPGMQDAEQSEGAAGLGLQDAEKIGGAAGLGLQAVAVSGNAEARSAWAKGAAREAGLTAGAMDKPLETESGEATGSGAAAKDAGEGTYDGNGTAGAGLGSSNDKADTGTYGGNGTVGAGMQGTNDKADAGVHEESSGTGEMNAQETAGVMPGKTPAEYVVKRGDTLTGISIRTYGSEKYVNRICQLNNIQNPDEIQEGQKILLP